MTQGVGFSRAALALRVLRVVREREFHSLSYGGPPCQGFFNPVSCRLNKYFHAVPALADFCPCAQLHRENNTWAHRDMEFLFDPSTRYRDKKLNAREEIPYLQESICYFVCYINTLLTRRSRLSSRFYLFTHYVEGLTCQ